MGQEPKYLYRRPKRTGIYWFVKRIRGNNGKPHRVSLKTKDKAEAIIARDALLKRWDEIDRKGTSAKNMLALRKQYLAIPENHDARTALEEEVADRAEDIAQELGVLEKLDSRPEDLSAKDADKVQQVKRAYDVGVGKLTLFVDFVPDWLETIENKKTRSDYRRAFDLLMKEYVAVEELNWDKCKVFLRDRIRIDKKSRATVDKWKGAYINFWDWLDKDTNLWRAHKLPVTDEIEIQEFDAQEVRAMYDVAKQQQQIWGPWLHHVIWIAAHTGARAGAIRELKYNRENQTIWFPKKKKEKRDRTIPAHPAVWQSLVYWENNRKAVQTISNKFGDLKESRGWERDHVFHSFRHTLVTQLEILGCPEKITTDITGHKPKGTAYAMYGHGPTTPQGIENMREWLNKVRY